MVVKVVLTTYDGSAYSHQHVFMTDLHHMERSLLTCTLALSLVPVSAQQWCAPGSEWLFGFWSLQATGVRHAWYAGDTIVGGLAAKRIDQDIHAYQPVPPFGTPFYTTAQSLITAEVGDMVMLWDNGTSSYDTLMWFGAVPGQSWRSAHHPGPAHFDVLDTGTMVVEGIPLRFLVVEEPVVMGVTDTLLERIGFDYFYLFPDESFLLDFTTTWLQCYHDTDIPEFDGNVQLHPCDVTLAMDQERPDPVNVFPNPGEDVLTLALLSGEHRIVLFDATGRIALSEHATGSRVRMATGGLPAGPYVIRVDGSRPVRWVKQ